MVTGAGVRIVVVAGLAEGNEDGAVGVGEALGAAVVMVAGGGVPPPLEEQPPTVSTTVAAAVIAIANRPDRTWTAILVPPSSSF
ncbi:hypothetical protein [Streptacidiphilus anmyonensis]|uniref:hypothetical protein n=1 Tax=Streptacidiphilus anmyonensis TaxID=405782 RepID=UPI00128BC309|nr:hypothetical protein [Streptacidiphilus anmyonensis]